MSTLMQIIENPVRARWNSILARPAMNTYKLEEAVLHVLKQVKLRGDEAAREFTREFDGVDIAQPVVTADEFREAEKALEPSVKQAILTAIANITKFHQAQLRPEISVETMPGVKCWQKSVPVEKVGLYIPGGTAPLFSTVLMLGIPAKIAGCGKIVVCTPPDRNGKIHPAILYSARMVGLQDVYKIGGVQAIAAMAYGTALIPSVYKIFGPGNQYVTMAKQMVSKDGVAIDMPAGPSEVMVIADNSSVPAFVASDLLSQAEHGVDSQVMLVTSSKEIIEPVLQELQNQLSMLPRKDIASCALENSKVILLQNEADIPDLINQYAPEHLIIATSHAKDLADKVANAGSVFIGNYSSESAGDYASGTNHTLPTSGYAKVFSGVNMDSFVKKITFQEISGDGLINIGPVVMEMATVEALEGHRKAIKLRLDSIKNKVKPC